MQILVFGKFLCDCKKIPVCWNPGKVLEHLRKWVLGFVTLYDIFTRHSLVVTWLLATIKPLSWYDCNRLREKQSPIAPSHDLLVSFEPLFPPSRLFRPPCLVLFLISPPSLSVSNTFTARSHSVPVTVYSSQSHWHEASLSQKPHTVWLCLNRRAVGFCAGQHF